MTATTATTAALDPLERQAAARDAYLTSVAEGSPLSGAELGRRFGRTDRWGRYQISQARAHGAGNNGNRPTRPPEARRATGNDRTAAPTRRNTDGNGQDTRPAVRERPTAERQAETPPVRRNGNRTSGRPARPSDPSGRSGDPAGTAGDPRRGSTRPSRSPSPSWPPPRRTATCSTWR